MLVTRSLDAVSAGAAATNGTVAKASGHHPPYVETATIYIQASDDPTAEALAIVIESRPGPDCDWLVESTFAGAITAEGWSQSTDPGGSGAWIAKTTVAGAPQIRARTIQSGGSTNVLDVFIVT
jgi:hypothetical protein